MGRPSFSPTAEQREIVSALAQAHVAQAEIARRIGVTKKTLQKHFAGELGRENTTGAEGVKTGARVKTPPPFQATAEQRDMVEILAAAGMPRPQIADKIGVSVEILQYHFETELREGPGKRRADGLLAIYRGMMAGNGGDKKLWEQITSPAAPKVAGVKVGTVGKKAAAQAEAEAAIEEDPDFNPGVDAPPPGTPVH